MYKVLQKEINGFIILHQENISFDAHCIDNTIAVMERFSLDSSCPIHPYYHRRFAIYESNMLRPYKTFGVELHEFCIVFKKDVWEKILTLDLRVIDSKIKELNLKHGLICNALIYAW